MVPCNVIKVDVIQGTEGPDDRDHQRIGNVHSMGSHIIKRENHQTRLAATTQPLDIFSPENCGHRVRSSGGDGNDTLHEGSTSSWGQDDVYMDGGPG